MAVLKIIKMYFTAINMNTKYSLLIWALDLFAFLGRVEKVVNDAAMMA